MVGNKLPEAGISNVVIVLLMFLEAVIAKFCYCSLLCLIWPAFYDIGRILSAR